MIVPLTLIRIVGLLGLRIRLLIGVVVLLRISPLSGVVALRCGILARVDAVVRLGRLILRLVGVAVGIRDPGSVPIVRALDASRRGRDPVRISRIVGIAGIVRVPIRSAIPQVETAMSAIGSEIAAAIKVAPSAESTLAARKASLA